MVEEVKKGHTNGSLRSRTRTSSTDHGSNKLHPQEIMLIRRLWFEGWSEYAIWKEYRIPIPIIQKAKDEIERQATKEFENKESYAVELARLKHLLKLVIDTNNAITKDPSVSLADRLKSESIKLEALAILQNAVIASISSSDPRIALEKIVEKSSGRQR